MIHTEPFIPGRKILSERVSEEFDRNGRLAGSIPLKKPMRLTMPRERCHAKRRTREDSIHNLSTYLIWHSDLLTMKWNENRILTSEVDTHVPVRSNRDSIR
jgi:hypothetical protein